MSRWKNDKFDREKDGKFGSKNWRFQAANKGMQLAAGRLAGTAGQLAKDGQTRSTAAHGRTVRNVRYWLSSVRLLVVAMAIADEWLMLARRIIPVWWRSANTYRALAHYNGSLQAGSVFLTVGCTAVTTRLPVPTYLPTAKDPPVAFRTGPCKPP